VFTQTVAENYTSVDLKRIHWDRVVAENRAKVTTTMSPTELFDILEPMIKPIGDSHTGIEAPQLKRQFEGSPGTDRLLYTKPTKNFRKGTCTGCWRLPTGNGSKGPVRKFCNDQIQYGHIDNAIGYLRILSFSSTRGGSSNSNLA